MAVAQLHGTPASEGRARNMIRYAIERASDALPDIRRLAAAHWAEMESDRDALDLAPNYDFFLKAEQAGMIALAVARRGELVGYFPAILARGTNSMGALNAESLPYYVVPCRDRGIILRGLLRTMRNHLAAAGVIRFSVRNAVEADAGPIFLNLDFRAAEIVYSCILNPHGPPPGMEEPHARSVGLHS